MTEYVHHTTIEGIGMIAALVVERVPQTAADVLARSTAEYIVAGERITGGGIMLKEVEKQQADFGEKK